MKYKIVLALLMFLCILPQTLAAEECNKNFQILVQLKTLNQDNIEELSRYQMPNYREDDVLKLWRMHVTNKADCKSEAQYLKLEVLSPKEEKKDLCRVFQIPELMPDETYSIWYKGFYNNTDYIDSNNDTFIACGVRLLSAGLWKVDGSLEPIDKTARRPGVIGWSLIDDKNNAYHLDFKVVEKSLLLSQEIQKQTKNLAITAMFITILIGVAGISTQIYSSRWQIKKRKEHRESIQRDLLKSIYTLTRIIQQDIGSPLIEFNKKQLRVPSYFITTIPSSFYLTNLDSKFREKETENLKEFLVKAQHKIDAINRLLKLIQSSHIAGEKGITKGWISEVTSDYFKYNKDLTYLLSQIDSELNSFKWQ